jgi:integrase/recombinase XerD
LVEGSEPLERRTPGAAVNTARKQRGGDEEEETLMIKLKKAPRQIAQRILSEVQIALLIRATKTDRDRLMFDLAYFGGLRVSELVSLTWGQVIRRDSGEAQFSIVGKGSKGREVLIPAVDSRGDAPASGVAAHASRAS